MSSLTGMEIYFKKEFLQYTGRYVINTVLLYFYLFYYFFISDTSVKSTIHSTVVHRITTVHLTSTCIGRGCTIDITI